jgi:hypothetical protein
MRCLLPKTLLDNGFFPLGTEKSGENKKCNNVCNYSWSGQRKIPSYVNKLVFPEKFMATLRTIAMQEDELFKVSSMLEEVQFLCNIFFLWFPYLAPALVNETAFYQDLPHIA